jgi:hypothetical protein
LGERRYEDFVGESGLGDELSACRRGYSHCQLDRGYVGRELGAWWLGDDVRSCVSCGYRRDYPRDNKLGCEGAKGIEIKGTKRGISEVLEYVRESSLDGFVCVREFIGACGANAVLEELG